MIPYMIGKLAPNSSHLTRGLVKYVPGRGYFGAVSSQNGEKNVTSPPPAQSLNGSKEQSPRQVFPERYLPSLRFSLQRMTLDA